MESPFEHMLLNSHKPQMLSYISEHPDSFEEAIRLAISNHQPYSWRASWLLWSCMKKNDKRVQQYVPDIIRTLAICRKNQKRELLKILYEMEISEDLEGTLFDLCIDIWIQTDSQPSVRFNAFRMLSMIAKRHPELTEELRALSEDHYLQSLSAGVKRSLKKMFNNDQ
ncbi:MAG: hypothetical protein ACOYOA_10375 [Saprospiraceae bacterium]